MSGSTKAQADQLKQQLKIVQLYSDALRKQQEVRFAPWQVAFAGMTAGAALFAAGIAFARVFMP